MAKVRPPTEQPAKPNIKCTRHECASGLHSFSPRSRKKDSLGADCRGCGAIPVDWSIPRSMELAAFPRLVPELRKEWIRNYFFGVDLHQKAINYALRRGRSGLHERFRHFLSGKFAATPGEFPEPVPVDGPGLHASPLHYARHATACCCRRCFYYWYGVARDRALLESELEFATGLCMRYIELKLPDLGETPMQVPPLRGVQEGRTP